MKKKLGAVISSGILIAAILAVPAFGASPTPTPTPTVACSVVQSAKAIQVINAQNKALSLQDYKTAETYSSTHFRSTVTLAQFKSTIVAHYPYLGKLSSANAVACIVVKGFVVIAMNLIDLVGVQHHIIYGLTPIAPKNQVLPNNTGWGIDGVHVSS